VDEEVGTPCYEHKVGSYEWTSISSLNERRERFTMTVVGELIAVIGGFKAGTDVEVYRNETWQSGPNLEGVHGLVHHCAVSYGKSKVMVIGGFYDGAPTDIVQTVDLETNEVKMVSSLNTKRYSHACSDAVWEGEKYIVVAGGFETYHVCNTVEYISACETDSGYYEYRWQTMAPMNIRRYNFALTIFGTQLAAFGGQPTIKSDQIEVFNATSKVWELTRKHILRPEIHFFAGVSVPEMDLPVYTAQKYPEHKDDDDDDDGEEGQGGYGYNMYKNPYSSGNSKYDD